MSEESSSNPTLYFLVGGLLVAVLAIGYFAMGRSTSDATAAPSAAVAAPAPEEKAKSSFNLDIGKDGTVSGSISKESEE